MKPAQNPRQGEILTIEQAMRLAIRCAYTGAPHVSPNPLVGAVVLDSTGAFLQAGAHLKYGEAHAEVNALRGLTNEQLQGAHVIVTLEPCAHEGKTPSCAKMMAKLPLARVTYGLVDPNPLVAGQGAEILKQAGIDARLFSFEDKDDEEEIKADLEQVCEVFLKNYREKKIFITLKMASSLDGQIALKSGESQWITGPESREHVHWLRACYDAIVVGAGTVQHDNPSLNIRHPRIQKENKIVVLDSEARVLSRFADLNLAKVRAANHVIWCVAAELREELLKQITHWTELPLILYVKTNVAGEFDMTDLHDQLWKLGIRSLMIEGGAATASAFINARMVDRLFLFQANILMGAGGAISWTSQVKLQAMRDKIVLSQVKRSVFGADQLITGIFKN